MKATASSERRGRRASQPLFCSTTMQQELAQPMPSLLRWKKSWPKRWRGVLCSAFPARTGNRESCTQKLETDGGRSEHEGHDAYLKTVRPKPPLGRTARPPHVGVMSCRPSRSGPCCSRQSWCSYLPLESGSVLPNHNEPALVLPDRNAYDWSITVTHVNGSSYSHYRSNASNTMSVYQLTGGGDVAGTLNITVDLIDNQTSVWDSSIDKVRVLIGLLKVPNATTNNAMEDRAGWLMQAIEGELDRPNNSKNSLSLELVQDEVESGACYLVHIKVAHDRYADATAPGYNHPTFIVQPLYIEYDGASCPLRDSDGDGYTDVQENLANSNPNSSSSVPNMTDSDGDGVPDLYDDANCTQSGWTSNASTDHDRDGCKDHHPNKEDDDDDNDGIIDEMTIAANHRFRLVEIFPYTITTGTVALIYRGQRFRQRWNVRWERIIQRYCPNCIQLRCRA